MSSRTVATVALSGSNFVWANITGAQTGSGGPTNLQSDNGPVTVTGSIRASAGSGASSIVVMSPANLTGSNNGSHQLGISQFSLTCAGSGNVGSQPTYVTPFTQLTASATTACASWGPGATSRLNFAFNLYLNTRGLQSDTYRSTNFALIATST